MNNAKAAFPEKIREGCFFASYSVRAGLDRVVLGRKKLQEDKYV